MKFLPDYIKDEVTAISTIASPVYFHFGNWQELCIDLADKAQSKTYSSLRYPLVFLHNDYKETIMESQTKSNVTGLKIYIIAQSYISSSTANEANYTTQERWDNIYKLVLNPIYVSLINQMIKSNNYEKEWMRIKHTKKNLFKLWVGDNKNRLPDYLDAIEITFDELIYNLNKFS